MAGSFDVFRKYQRSLLVFVAILAMLAFFVLPPFLQMGGGGTGPDPVVATWTGGDISEGGLERALAMRSLVNRFLVEAAVAAGRDPARLPLFPETEEQVVRNLLLAREAEANGIVVGDAAVNDFLGQWTGNMVRQEQFDEIISRLRLGPTAVSQHDLFAALRTELAARNMLTLFQSGFAANPPGWRWDYFRRLEQKAVVEAVPVIVETFAGEVAVPQEQALRTLFEAHKDDLPEPRSPDPGFREPHRVKYEYLVARREAFQAEAAKAVTDAEIEEYYEKNKVSMFRAAPAEKPGDSQPAEPKPAAAASGEAGSGNTKPVETRPEAAGPAETKPPDAKAPDVKAPDVKAPEKSPPVGNGPEPKAPQPPAGGGQGEFSRPRRPVSTVAFRQPADGKAAAVAAPQPAVGQADGAKAAEKIPDEKKPDDGQSAAGRAGGGEPAASSAEQPAAEQPPVEPLEKVRERIRDQLARERAERRIDAVFTAVAADLTAYAEDHALWLARRDDGVPPPRMPDFEAIAKVQGLEAVRSGLVAADTAVADDAVGGSFELVPDAGSRFGIRQQRWIDMIYGQGAMPLRPVTSRDVAGNRYLSWKTEDQPAFVPSFETARPDVERAWRIIEARGLAERRAGKIVAEAAARKQSLEAALAADPGLKAGQPDMKASVVGPFTWLRPGTAMTGGAPSVSQPEGLFMPGDALMRAVFGLEPGETAVAFNEPRTVCYCIRLVSLEPAEAALRERFIASKDDQSGPATAAQLEFGTAFREWVDGLESRYALDWKRQPRVAGR